MTRVSAGPETRVPSGIRRKSVALPSIRSRRGKLLPHGHGSLSAHVPRPRSLAYTASKHAVTGITRAVALDGRAYNIACGQIDIGNAATDLTATMAAGALQPDGSIQPEPVIPVEAVARGVLYMAGLPLDANVLHLTVMATGMPYAGRG